MKLRIAIPTRIGRFRFGTAAAFCLIAIAVWRSDSADAGSTFDVGFGTNGRVIAPSGVKPWGERNWDFTGGVTALKVDRMSRILVGTSNGRAMVVKRLLPDGRLDESFGSGGKAVLLPRDFQYLDSDRASSTVTALGLQSDGKIIAIGSAYMRVGSGQLLVPRTFRFRLTPNGSIDSTFVGGLKGKYDESFWAQEVTVLKSDAFLVAGRQPMSCSGDNVKSMPSIIKYSRNGYHVESFGNPSESYERGWAGFASKLPPHGNFSRIKVVKGGKILAAGSFEGRPMVARFHRNGFLDRRFGRRTTPGRVVTPIFGKCRCTVTLGARFDRKDRIVMAGWTLLYRNVKPRFWVARFHANGKLDRSFGKNGKVVRLKSPRAFPVDMATEAGDLTIQRNGKIVVATNGGFDSPRLTIYRFNPDGSPDRTFYGDGRLVQRLGRTSNASSTLIDRKGRLLVGGGVLRNGNGHLLIERFTTR